MTVPGHALAPREPAPGVHLEVIVSSARDAEAAQEGGADRLELVSAAERGGLTPDAATLREVLRSTDLEVRVMLRAGELHDAAPGVADRLARDADELLAAGATAFVAGLVGPGGTVTPEAFGRLAPVLSAHPWTFHRALDECPELVAGVDAALAIPGCDGVLVSGDRHGLDRGLGRVLRLLRERPLARRFAIIGGGLRHRHLGAVLSAGATQLHCGRWVRGTTTWDSPVDATLVRSVRQAATVLLEGAVTTRATPVGLPALAPGEAV
jgi:copper homeostasis protein